MEHAETEFPGGGLVIWASKKRLIHLDAGVGDQSTTGQDGQAAGKGEKESRSNILHGGVREMRIFTGSSDSIGHRAAIRKLDSGVMVCELYTDKSTMHRRMEEGSGRTEKDWQFNCLQEAATVCYAVRSSFGERRSEPGGGPAGRKRAWSGFASKYPWSKVLAQIGRSAGHPERSLLAWKISQPKNQTVVKTG
jgi:hypothetical protein